MVQTTTYTSPRWTTTVLEDLIEEYHSSSAAQGLQHLDVIKQLFASELHVFSSNHQVDLSKAMVIDTHNHTHTRCMLESWHIEHHQSLLNKERDTLPGLYAVLLT